MPTIRTYQIQQSPTNQAPQVLVDADSFTSSGKQLETIGKTVSNVGEAFGKMQDMRDKLDANTQFRTKAGDIKIRMQQDPKSWDNQQKYIDELDKAKTDAMSLAKNNVARLSLEDELNTPYQSTLIDMRSHARTNLNNTMVAELKQNVDTLSNTYVTSNNPLEIHDAANGIRENIQKSIANGYIDAEKGNEYLTKTLEALPGKRVSSDIDNNPQMALANLQAGVYEGLKPGEKTKFEATANEALKRQQKIAAVNMNNVQTSNSIDVANAYLNNSLSKDSLDQMVVTGTISPKFAQTVNDAMNSSDTIKASTRADIYIDLMHKAYMDGENPKTIVESAMAAHSKGQLSSIDLNKFLQSSKAMFNGEQQQGEIKNQVDQMSQNTKNALKVVDDWVKNYKPGDADAHMNVIKDYQDKIDSGNDSSTSLQAAIKAQINKDYPETVAYGDVPHVVVAPNSKAKYIFMGKSNVAPHRIYQEDKAKAQ